MVTITNISYIPKLERCNNSSERPTASPQKVPVRDGRGKYSELNSTSQDYIKQQRWLPIQPCRIPVADADPYKPTFDPTTLISVEKV